MRFIFIVLFLIFRAHGSPSEPCLDSKVQEQRSSELQKIRDADQVDRSWQMKGQTPSLKTLESMDKNDLVRRKRVGEIFGEGCLKTADDFEAAYIVYQHGKTSDHYLQAFLWVKRAAELSKKNIKGEIAMAVDRYLVSMNHKQLFGTQAFKSDKCFCIQPVENTFPQKIRDEYRGGPNAGYTGLAYLKTLNANTDCPIEYCKTDLHPSPQGTVPGFW